MIDIRLKEFLHNLKDRDWDVLPTYSMDENEAKKVIEAIEDGGWIRCSERLPDENVDVLVYDFAFGEFHICSLTTTTNGEIAWEDEYGEYQDIGNVIAWQPLPEWSDSE